MTAAQKQKIVSFEEAMKNQPVNESNADETVSESELEELRSVVKRILRILEGYIELNALGSKK